MKFIDFDDKAINCISIEQWRKVAKRDNSRCKNSEVEKDVTLVCLSYDDGIRRERVSIAPHMAGKTKEVLHKESIYCHFAEIFYYDIRKGFWCLHLNFSEYPDFPFGEVPFKTREDAIKAARLCKNAKTVVEAAEIIAKEFPEFATNIFDFLKWYEETYKTNGNTNNI